MTSKITANGLLRGLSWPCIQELEGSNPNGTGAVSGFGALFISHPRPYKNATDINRKNIMDKRELRASN